jgi:hypothetical protein
MSILDAISPLFPVHNNGAAPPSDSSSLLARIEAAKLNILDCESKYQACLVRLASSDNLTTHEEVFAAEAKLAEAKASLRRLEAAVVAKKESDQQKERQKHLAIRKSQRQGFLIHARARQKHAARVTEIMAALKIEVDALMLASKKMRACTPVGDIYPEVSGLGDPVRLADELSRELWRVFSQQRHFTETYAARAEGRENPVAYIFPGQMAPDWVNLGLSPGTAPDAVPPLSERLRSRDDHLINIWAAHDGEPGLKPKASLAAKQKAPERMPEYKGQKEKPVSYGEAMAANAQQQGGVTVLGDIPSDFTVKRPSDDD